MLLILTLSISGITDANFATIVDTIFSTIVDAVFPAIDRALTDGTLSICGFLACFGV